MSPAWQTGSKQTSGISDILHSVNARILRRAPQYGAGNITFHETQDLRAYSLPEEERAPFQASPLCLRILWGASAAR